MMSYLKALKQDVTYWAPTSENEFGAKAFTRSQLKARWEDKSELFRDKNGQEVVSKSRVFLAQGVNINGYLFLGVSNASDPRTVSGAHEIRQTKTSPDLRNMKSLYVAIL
jgi:hypothetical protein